MNVVEAIRLLALNTVLHPDSDYRIRYILRWYSREFHTPLPQVVELPLEEVLRDYFECHYEDMDETQVQEELDRLLESDEERKAKCRAEDEADAEDAAFLKQLMEEEAKKVVEKEKQEEPAPAPVPKIDQDIPPPPDIKVSFVDPNLFEEALEGFGTMVQPPKLKK